MSAVNPIVLISLLVGFVAAGLVWVGWNLLENLGAELKQAKVRRAEAKKAKAEAAPKEE